MSLSNCCTDFRPGRMKRPARVPAACSQEPAPCVLQGLLVEIQQGEVRLVAQFALGEEVLHFAGGTATQAQIAGLAPGAHGGGGFLDQMPGEQGDAVAVGGGETRWEEPDIEYLGKERTALLQGRGASCQRPRNRPHSPAVCGSYDRQRVRTAQSDADAAEHSSDGPGFAAHPGRRRFPRIARTAS